MRRIVSAGLVAGSLALLVTGPPVALGQLTTAGIRGRVIDEAGNPVAGVGIEMEFKGESRKKITKAQESDKKGGFVRMGIPDGNWQISFKKEGYQPYVMEIYLSLGGFSECGDVVMKPAAAGAGAPQVPGAAPGGGAVPGGGAAPGAGMAEAGEAAQAGAVYAAAVEAAKAGRHDEAETAFKEVLVKYPDVPSIHYNLGYVYRMKKDWKAAEAEYLKVTELEPTRGDAFIALAAVREADGRSQEAAEGMIGAAPAFAADGRFQYALGVTCVNAGRSTEAEAALRKVMELDPSNPEAVYQLATVLVGQAKTPDAVGLLEKYIGMSGQDPANLQTANALLAALQKKK